MLIEVRNPTTNTRTHTNKETGQVLEFHSLEAGAILDPFGFIDKVKIPMETSKSVPAGTYLIKDSSYYSVQYGNLKLGNAELIKLTEDQVKLYMSLQLDVEQLKSFMDQRS